MSFLDILLLVLTMAIWGTNFVFIHLALTEIQPLALAGIRFFLVAIPAVFFIKKPALKWSQIALYGGTMFCLQFSFLFLGIRWGMPAGLASVIMQTQVFITLFMSQILLKESINTWSLISAVLAFLGVYLIGSEGAADVTNTGLLLTLMASMSWALGNVIVKTFPPTPPLSLIVWGALCAAPPLILASIIFEDNSILSVKPMDFKFMTWMSLIFIVVGSTHVAYSLWSHFLQKHKSSTIVPFTLLVPLFGLIGSHFVNAENVSPQKVLATFLILLGLAVHLIRLKLS